jgi:DNA-binding transcriptional LysR family regulator
MNFRQMEAFRAVMITGSVTKAGEMMHVSQPAVSQLLQQFESACGFALFYRRAGGLVPSKEAGLLLEEVERMFAASARVTRVAASLGKGAWGAFSIGAFPAMTRRFLPELVTSFCEQRPNIKVTVESHRSRSLIDWVGVHQVDFGLGTLASDREDVTSVHLCQTRGVCVLPLDHPLAVNTVIHAKQLEGERFISLGDEDQSRHTIDRIFDDQRIIRKVQIEAPQSDTACGFVAHRAGVSVVDPFSAYTADRTVVVRPFLPIVPFDVWLLLPKSHQRLRLVDEFIAHTKRRLRRFSAPRMAATAHVVVPVSGRRSPRHEIARSSR